MELNQNSEAVLWYKNVAYEDAKELLKENLVSTVAAFITAGYWLKYIRDNRSYEKDGYQNLWECAEKEFGLKISEASRAMSMNDKYSIDGNTPFMSESYKSYNKSQLQEMLTMTEEQIEQVTPDMTVKDIREIKSPKPISQEENLEKFKSFIHNFVRINYVRLNREFPEAAGVSIKRLNEMFDGEIGSHELIYFVLMGDKEAELVNADTGEIVAKCDSDTVITVIADRLDEVRKIKLKPVEPEVKGLLDDPYCRACGAPLNSPESGHASAACAQCGQTVDWTEYIKCFCDVAKDAVDTECEDELTEDIVTEIEVIPEAEEPLSVEFDTEELMQELEDVIDAEYREVKNFVEEESDAEQLEFPEFKNNAQRKAWIEDVEAWGLWYEDKNIQARYYKYDFPDGSRCIAVKYRYTCPPWLKDNAAYAKDDGAYKDTYYHMIYSEEYKKKHEYAYEDYYVHSTASVSTLVEFVKEITKKGVWE